MKKMLFISILFLFTSIIMAQEVMKFTTKQSNGWEKVLIVSDSTGTSYGYLPVKIMQDNSNAAGSPTYTRPYLEYLGIRDSVKGADTASYNFNSLYRTVYISIYNSHATLADTLKLENFSIAKNGWTYQALGWRDLSNRFIEIDNSSIIIPASTGKSYEVDMERIGYARVVPRNVVGRTTARRSYIYFKGTN